MKNKQVADVIYQFYTSGRASATNQNLVLKDMQQMVIMATAAMLREQYKEARATGNSVMDLIAGMISRKEYELGPRGINGIRKVIVDGKDEVMRLPNSTDLLGVDPLSEGCGKEEISMPTQISPGEERFYFGAEFSSFLFYVQKGNYIETLHYPPCVKKVSVERIFISDDMDIPMQVAFDVSVSVLKVVLGPKAVIPITDNSQDANRNELRYQLEKKNAEM